MMTMIITDSANLPCCVLLMEEAAATYSAIDARKSAELEKQDDYDPAEFVRLHRLRGKAWARYLRRWADACDNGHAGHWFEPWIAKKEAT